MQTCLDREVSTPTEPKRPKRAFVRILIGSAAQHLCDLIYGTMTPMGIYDRDWYRAETGNRTRRYAVPVAPRSFWARVASAVAAFSVVALNVLAAIPLLVFSLVMAVAGVVYVAGKYHVVITPIGTRPPDQNFWTVVSMWHIGWTDFASQQNASGLYTRFLFYNSNVISAVATAFLVPILCWTMIKAARGPRLLLTLIAIVAAEAWAIHLFDWTTSLSSWALLVAPAVVVGYGAVIFEDQEKNVTRLACFEPLVGAMAAGLCWGLFVIGGNRLGQFIGLDFRIIAVAFAASGAVALVLLPAAVFAGHAIERKGHA